MKATFVSKRISPSGAIQKIYRLDPPLEEVRDDEIEGPVDYICVSGVYAPYSGPETYIFPCNAKGEILSFLELPGSFRGAIDHDEALSNFGYEPVYESNADVL